MNFKKCPRCHKLFKYDSLCKCKPFKVFGEEFDEEGEIYYGYSFESVVENIAEKRNQNDPVFDDDLFEEPITVQDENGVIKKFNCYVSIPIDYYAKEVKI